MARIARGEEVVDSAMQVIANAVTVEQLRQAQAVVLPLRFAMSLEQTAAVTGLSVGWVSKQRNRFIQGKAVGDGTVPARGGRRRQNFTLKEETAVLKPFLEQLQLMLLYLHLAEIQWQATSILMEKLMKYEYLIRL